MVALVHHDDAVSIRQKAIERINDPDVLTELSDTLPSKLLKEAAMNRRLDVTCGKHEWEIHHYMHRDDEDRDWTDTIYRCIKCGRVREEHYL